MSHEGQLIEKVVSGDAQAADEFVRLYMNYLYSILTRGMGLDRDLANEIFNQLFVHLWEDDYRRLRQWTGRGSLKSYLAVVLKRQAVDILRKKDPFGNKGEDDPPNEGPGPDRLAEIGELRELIRVAMQELPETDRAVIQMVDLQGLKYREVAQRTGMTVTNVGVTLMRARERLMAFLQVNAPDLFPPAGRVNE